MGGKPDDFAAYRFDVIPGKWTALPEMIWPRGCTGNTQLRSLALARFNSLSLIKLPSNY